LKRVGRCEWVEVAYREGSIPKFLGKQRIPEEMKGSL